MSTVRLLGLGLAIAGIVFLIVGINSTGAPVDQLSKAFLGRYTQDTVMYLAAGTAAIVAGGIIMLNGRGGRRL